MSDEVGEIPEYLQQLLKIHGFETAGAFRLLKNDDQYDKLIKELNGSIKMIYGKDEGSNIRTIIKGYFDGCAFGFDGNSVIPYGHELLIKSVIEFSQKPSNSIIYVEEVASCSSNDDSKDSVPIKNEKETDISKKALAFLEKFVNEMNIKQQKIRDLKCFLKNGDWFSSCCYCHRDVKIFVDKGINISNFKTHVKLHSTANSTSKESTAEVVVQVSTSRTLQVDSSELLGETSSSATSSPITSPPKKKANIQKSNTEIIKKELLKKLSDYEQFITPTLVALIENALKNKSGFHGNRFDLKIKQLGLYFLIRGGSNFYNVLVQNISLPSYKTITRFMDQYHERLIEGKLYVKELHDFIVKRNIKKCVSIIEDATVLTKLAEYESSNNIILGLPSPFNPKTGMVYPDYFKADTAAQIAFNIKNWSRAGYMFVILAKPVEFGSPTFVLAFYGSDNKFTHEIVSARYKYIQKELDKWGIELVCTGSDGDSRFIKSQKDLLKFGNVEIYKNIEISGSLSSKIFAYQDGLHIVKKLNHALYDTCDVLRIGNYSATLRHLIIMYKMFHKCQHNLNLSDLDPNDKMDYDRLFKITDSKVIELLEKVDESKGTIALLKLLKSVLLAYVNDGIPDGERVANAIYACTFLRYWCQWLRNEKIPMKNFITRNAFEGLEINLILVIHLIKMGNLKFIHLISSQNNEEFFRLLRSYTGIECLSVNCSVKGFISKLKRIQMEESLMYDLKDEVNFPKLQSREKKKQNIKLEDLDESEVEKWLEKGTNEAIKDCNDLGMFCKDVDLKGIIGFSSTSSIDDEDDEHDDFLGAENEILDSSSLVEYEDEIDNIVIEDVEFLNKNTDDDLAIVKYDGKEIELKKTNLCFLLQGDVLKVKNTKRERFISKKGLTLRNASSEELVWRIHEISIGEWIVICQDSQFYVGRVLNFQRIKGKTKKERLFIGDTLDVNKKEHINVSYLLEPYYKISQAKLKIMKAKSKTGDYFDILQYICHIRNNNVEIRAVLKDITKFFTDSFRN